MSEYETQISGVPKVLRAERKAEPQNKSCTERKLIYSTIKRIFDLGFSLTALLVLFPLQLVICLAILFEDHSDSPIYRSERIGKNGRPFLIYKFRSMKKDADNLEDMLNAEQLEQYRKHYKVDNDPRITKVGRFLRKTSMDELPQLFNILRGDLSLVGPRPVLLEETYKYGSDRDKFLSVIPGLTGYWQAYARNDADYESGERQRMELFYIDHRSFILDLKVIGKTFGAVIKKTGK